jgi:propanediol dehydratase small subunit
MALEINLQQAIDNMQTALANQQTAFATASNSTAEAFQDASDLRQTNFESLMNASIALVTIRANTSFTNVNITANENERITAEDIRLADELLRKGAEIIRVANDVDREAIVLEAMAWYNETNKTGSLPVFLDGGDFGDVLDGLTYNGGDF